MNGTDVLVKVNTGTVSVPVWTTVGKQTGASITEATASIDESSKEQRERRVVAGRYTSTVSLNALYVPDNAAYTALRDAMRSGALVQLQSEVDGVADEEADAVITNLSADFPDQGAATISASFDVDGAWAAAA